MQPERRIFPSSRIARVARVDEIPGTQGPLFGDHVRLNSGGPLMLVVDIDGERIAAATDDGREYELPRPCLSLLARASGAS